MAVFDVGIRFAVTGGASVIRGINNIDRGLARIGRTADGNVVRLRAFQAVLAGIATGAAVQLGRRIVQTAADFETLQVRLAQTEGGLKNAQRQYASFVKTFGASSIDINTVADGFQKLRIAGLSTADANKVLLAGANAVTAFGGSTQDLNRLIIGMTQAIGKGTLSMEEMRQQIGEAVPSAMRVLAREMNTTIPELFRMIEDGAVDSTEAMKKLSEGLQKDFGDALEIQARTIAGALGRLRSSTSVAIGELFNQDTDGGRQLVALINRITDGVVGFIKAIDQDAMDRFFETLNAGVTIGQQMAGAFVALSGIANQFVNDILAILNGLGLGGSAGFGIIGFFLLGPRGAIAGTLLGLVANQFGAATSTIQESAATIKAWMDSTFGKAAAYGLIGFVLFGKFGAAAGVVIAIVRDTLQALGLIEGEAKRTVEALGEIGGAALQENREFIDKAFLETVEGIDKLSKRLETTTFNFGSNTAKKMQQQLDELIKGADRFEEKLVNASKESLSEKSAENLKRAEKDLAALRAQIVEIIQLMGGKMGEATAVFAGKVAQQAERATAAMKGFEASVTNDAASSAMLRLEGRTARVRVQLEKVRDNYEKLGDTSGIAKINGQLAQLDGLQKQGISNIGATTSAQNSLNASQQEGLRLSTKQQMLDLQIQEAGRLFAGFADEAARKRLTLEQGIIGTKEKILQLEKEALTASGATKAQIQQTIAVLKQFQEQQQNALENTSATALLAQDAWLNVAGAIEGSLKEALKGFVNGTLDAEKVLLSFYDKITDAAIDYLFELIKIQLRQQIIGALAPGAVGGSTGAFNPFSLLGFANGGAFKGQVTPFANGGVISGPTLFGLAGEAGDEAIMPLERIGGKLGVNAANMDGGTYNINISAIDTQTGAQFLQKNSQQIINQLRQADRLNRGVGGVR